MNAQIAGAAKTVARSRHAAQYVILGGAIAATLDILYACGFSNLVYGVPPLRILQSVASGLLGASAFTGGIAAGALGLLLHYLIALGAAFVFYAASRRFGWLIRHAIVAGIVFGLCVYGVMNFVVIPLSAFPRKLTFPPLILATGLFVHMFFVGVPIALGARAASRQA